MVDRIYEDFYVEPTQRDIAVGQSTEALERLDTDFTKAPRVPWQSVHDLVGPFLPGTWHIWGAFPGRGKSTAALNLISALAEQGKRVVMLALEQEPSVMRLQWASIALGYNTSLVLENRWYELPRGAKEAIQNHVTWQCEEHAETIRFPADRFLDPAGIPRLFEREAKAGCDLIVIDHLARTAEPGYLGISLAAKAITEGTRSSGVPALALAQLGQGPQRDLMKAHTPMQLEDLYGSTVPGQEASVVGNIFWPLSPLATKADIDAVRRREKSVRDILMADKVAMAFCKHRTRGGSALGSTCLLDYKHGKLTDPESRRVEALEERESDWSRKRDDPPPPDEPPEYVGSDIALQEDMWEEGRE